MGVAVQTKKKTSSQLISCLILVADAELSLLIPVPIVKVVPTAQGFQHNVCEKGVTWATHIIIHFFSSVVTPACAAAFG